MSEYLRKNFDGSESEKSAAIFLGYGGYSIIRHWLVEASDKTLKEIETIVSRLMNHDLLQ